MFQAAPKIEVVHRRTLANLQPIEVEIHREKRHLFSLGFTLIFCLLVFDLYWLALLNKINRLYGYLIGLRSLRFQESSSLELLDIFASIIFQEIVQFFEEAPS